MGRSVWDQILKDDGGERPTRPWPRTRRPAAGETVEFCLMEREVERIWVHWLAGATKACLGSQCPCYSVAPRPKLRRVGYILAIEMKPKRLAVAEITDGALISCPDLCNTDLDLRGACLTLQREAGRANGAVTAELRLQRWRVGAVPPISTRQVLERMWWGDRPPLTWGAEEPPAELLAEAPAVELPEEIPGDARKRHGR